MEKKKEMMKYFEEVEVKEEHEEYEGYFCKIPEAITITILGTLCGLENMKKIHQWASSEGVKEFLKAHFKIERVPC